MKLLATHAAVEINKRITKAMQQIESRLSALEGNRKTTRLDLTDDIINEDRFSQCAPTAYTEASFRDLAKAMAVPSTASKYQAI